MQIVQIDVNCCKCELPAPSHGLLIILIFIPVILNSLRFSFFRIVNCSDVDRGPTLINLVLAW